MNKDIYDLCTNGRNYLYDKEIELLKELDKAKNENMKYCIIFLTEKLDDVKIEIEKANKIIKRISHMEGLND